MNRFRFWSRHAWLLHGYLLATLLLPPFPLAHAYWTDTDSDGVLDSWTDENNTTQSMSELDTQGVDIDVDGAYNEEEQAYGSDPLDYDTDNDGLNDGDEIHLAIQQGGKSYLLTAWDSNGDEVSDFDDFYNFFGVTYLGGQIPNLPGASYSDYDGDGIKNPNDNYPTDPNNNDSDHDGLDDSTDPVVGDPNNLSPCNSISWGGDALNDADNDATSNFWDPYPYDSGNGSNDPDSDGIDNSTDPYPSDYANYSPQNGINWYGDVLGDADADGTQNYADEWPYDAANGYVDGYTSNDDDNDGLTNDLDPATGDPNNYSSINGYNWNGSALEDADNDGTNNFNDPYPYDMYNNMSDNDSDGWDNVDDPFPLDASNFSDFNQISWGSTLFEDADGDTTPNWQDTYPYDPYNGSSDYDSDGVPNDSDPYPNDSSNSSSVNQVAWGSNVLGDDDLDGTPNWQDDTPYATTGTTGDSDNDGFDDASDPMPDDASNYSSYNSTSWGADVFSDADNDGTQNFWDQWPYDASNGVTTVTDSDADSIPDDTDPAPYDSANYSTYNWQAWYGSALNDDDSDGTSNFYDAEPSGDTTTNNNIDGDSYDDSIDPVPNDYSNSSPYNGIAWSEDVFGDADFDQIQNFWDQYPYDANNGMTLPMDSDLDGISDIDDPAAGDYNNYSEFNMYSWYSDALGDADTDGIANFYDYQPYGDSNADSDNDGLLDTNDPIPTDPNNLSSFNNLAWPSGALDDADNDTIANFFDDTPYGVTAPLDGDGDGLYADEEADWGTSDSNVDSDGDTLSDGNEVHGFGSNPANAYSISEGLGWGDLYNDADMVDTTDTDRDGMPDSIELHYGMNPNWALDALLDRDNDGINNITQYHAGIALNANLSTYDDDGDGMSDVFEDAWLLQKTNPHDAVHDADGDGVLNYEEQRLLLSPQNVDTLQQGGLGDLLELMLSVRYPDGSNPSADDSAPANNIPDWVDAVKSSPTAPDYDHFTRQLSDDLDGDGMPDAWEHQYGAWKYPVGGLNLRDARDALLDPDHDGLNNLTEYRFDSDPLVSDSLHNGVSDSTRLYAQSHTGTTTTGLLSRYQAQIATDFSGTRGQTGWSKQFIVAPSTQPQGPYVITKVNVDYKTNHTKSSIPPDTQSSGYSEASSVQANSERKPDPLTNTGCTCGCRGSYENQRACPGTSDACSCGANIDVPDYDAEPTEVIITEAHDNYSEPCCHCPDGTDGSPHSSSDGCSYWYQDFLGTTPATTELTYPTKSEWQSYCACTPPTNTNEDQQWTTQKAYFQVSLSEADAEDHRYLLSIESSDGNSSTTWVTIPTGTTGPVEISQEAPEGGSVTISYNEPEDFQPDYPSFNLSASDSAGSRYRKIGLNGMPVPDSKPQMQDESGERGEETYIDAFTRQLHHSVTDVYANDPSTLLPLSVRRDSSSESWNQRSGQRIDERPELPFGPSWSSNLCSYVHFETRSDSTIKSAQVVDEQGAGRRFLSTVNGTSGWCHSMEEKQDMHTIGDVFTGMTLSKKFGTLCTYEMVGITQTFSNDRLDGSDDFTTHTYARLQQVRDRLGNRLVYSYSGNSLIPDSISDPDRPGRQVFIMHDGRRVSAVRGPSGKEVSYAYTEETGFLSTVTSAGTAVKYEYQTLVEDDINAQTYGGNPTPITHHELASITDELDRNYQFTRIVNHEVTNENLTSEGYIETRIQLGLPMLVTGVTQPGTQHFIIVGSRSLSTHLTGLFPVVAPTGNTTVLGTAGTFNYTFSDAFVYTPQYDDPLGLDDDVSALNYTVTYLNTTITSEAGMETYIFNPAAMFALSSATDLSGNQTTFGYEGGWDDPVTETDALNNTKTYTYDPATRIMTSMTDAIGTITAYDIENRVVNNENILGLKVSEVVTSSTGETRATYYAYDHPTFHGMVTKQWTVSSEESAMPSSVTLTALGNPTDAEGANPGWWAQVTQTTGPATTQGTLASTLTTATTIRDFSGNKRTIIDGRGLLTNFDYDEHLRLSKTTHPDGYHKDLEYDAHGNLVKETHEDGVAVIHTYDELNRRIQTTIDLNGNGMADAAYTTVDVSGSAPVYDGDIVTSTTYNARSQIITATDARGTMTTNTYDDAGRLITAETDGLTTQFFYDGVNNGGSVFDTSNIKANRIIDPRGTVTSVEYDALYRPVTHTAAVAGINAVTQTSYDALGHPLTVTDPLNRVTTKSYNGLGELVQVSYPDGTTVNSAYTHIGKPWQVTNEMGNTTTTSYDAAGRAIMVQAPAVNGEVATHTSEYDAAGNVIRVTDALGRETETVYDERNRPVAVYAPTVWDSQSGAFVQPISSTTYDALGQVLTVTDPQGNVTKKFYDAAGRIWKVVAPVPETGMPSPTSINTFDAGGLALTVTNPLNQTVTNTYDSHGRLLSTVDAEGITNSFAYDDVGNRTSVKDGKNQETIFEYDGLNRITSQTFANGDTTNFTYNAVQKLSQTTPRGITTSYTYDDRDRVLTASAPAHDSTPALSRSYSYDDAGHLLGVTEAGHDAATVAYTYDALGRVTSETSLGITHSYSYDLAGNRTQANYGTGRSVQTSYDALNRPELISEGGRVTRYGYDLGGRAVVLVAGNGQTSSNSYDNLGRLVDRTLFKTTGMSESEVLAEFSWTHDLLGNVTQQLETWPGDVTRSSGIRSTTMTYDDDNRLASETVVENLTYPTTGVTATGYTYDDANNRVQKSVIGGSDPGVWHYTYNAANQLTSWEQWDTEDSTLFKSATLTYDDAGNRTSQSVSITGGATGNGINPPPAVSGTTGYQWDAQDRLSSVTMPDGTQHTYDYDYRTRRIGTHKLASGVQQTQTAIVFTGGLSLAEWESQTDTLPTTPTVEYTRGPDMGGGVGGMLYSMRGASSTSAPTVKYSLSNGRGDIVAQADSSATLTWTASYEAYGRRTKETGDNQDKQRGNSKDEDPTGLLNEGFRYRDLETGVWLSRDPAGFVDGPNVYAYVQQNPWTGWDPEGLETKKQLEESRDTLDKAYHQQVKDIKGMTGISDKDRSAGLKSLDERYNKARNGLNDRIGKIERTAKDMAEIYGGKADDYHNQLDDSKANVRELIGLMEHLDGSGFRQNVVDAAKGDVEGALIAFGKGVVLDRALRALKYLKLLKPAARAGSAKDLVSDKVRAFMKGEKKLSDLSAEEVKRAMQGYQNAADAAKNAAHKAYQEARMRALRGEGSPPGSLLDFMKKFNGEGGGN